MSDRELLEFAAKAAGVELIQMPPGVYRNATGAKPENNAFGFPTWNPITDDGDAFRLMERLKFDILYSDTMIRVYPRLPKCIVIHQEVGDDRLVATRRAIVRAAAEIGKGMK